MLLFAAPVGVRFCRLARTLAWNGLLVFAGAALIAISAEAYMRAEGRFAKRISSGRFVLGVGRLDAPNTEVRATNGVDFWTHSRTNSLGFLDREPISPKRAAATCHIAVIGDSRVKASQVPIADKLQVRSEELASRTLPHLRITVSAFGRGGTGQVQQLAYYDEYARHLRPKLVVLVFVPNDFVNNYAPFRAIRMGMTLENLRDRRVERMPNGELTLRLPAVHPGPKPQSYATSRTLLDRTWARAAEGSVFAFWLRTKTFSVGRAWLGGNMRFMRRWYSWRGVAEQVERSPLYVQMFDEWSSPSPPIVWHDLEMAKLFAADDPHPIFEDALDYTAFALGQFKMRADRDSTQLVVLASHPFRQTGGKLFERLSDISAAVDVPVIDQAEYILRQGAELADAQWAHDDHWNVAGHRWAAEALLEYIGEHQGVCGRG